MGDVLGWNERVSKWRGECSERWELIDLARVLCRRSRAEMGIVVTRCTRMKSVRTSLLLSRICNQFDVSYVASAIAN